MSGEDFQRYLEAKRTVDDRSLDRRLLESLASGLAERSTARNEPIRLLEVGAGIGTMVERMLEWELLPRGAITYTTVDVDADSTARLPDRLETWATDRAVETDRHNGEITLSGDDRQVTVEVRTADAVEFARTAERSWDLLVGMAFLDIVDQRQLVSLLSTLAPGGLWYFPVTFDGGTRFAPDHPADDTVERRYHRHMNSKPGGDSNAGTHVLDQLRRLDGTTVTGVAGSDWVVYPREDGYHGDEAYFLRYILGTIESALRELGASDELAEETLDDWLRTRRRQITDSELVYTTHQLDLLGRTTSPPES
jgi:hypothetical protein